MKASVPACFDRATASLCRRAPVPLEHDGLPKDFWYHELANVLVYELRVHKRQVTTPILYRRWGFVIEALHEWQMIPPSIFAVHWARGVVSLRPISPPAIEEMQRWQEYTDNGTIRVDPDCFDPLAEIAEGGYADESHHMVPVKVHVGMRVRLVGKGLGRVESVRLDGAWSSTVLFDDGKRLPMQLTRDGFISNTGAWAAVKEGTADESAG